MRNKKLIGGGIIAIVLFGLAFVGHGLIKTDDRSTGVVITPTAKPATGTVRHNPPVPDVTAGSIDELLTDLDFEFVKVEPDGDQ